MEAGQIKALWIMATNPAVSCQTDAPNTDNMNENSTPPVMPDAATDPVTGPEIGAKPDADAPADSGAEAGSAEAGLPDSVVVRNDGTVDPPPRPGAGRPEGPQGGKGRDRNARQVDQEGRGALGRPVAAGVYLVRLQTRTHSLIRRIVRMG